MNKIYPEHLIELAKTIEEYKRQYPTADIYFDLDENRILVTLPLPKDFPKLMSWNIEDDENV